MQLKNPTLQTRTKNKKIPIQPKSSKNDELAKKELVQKNKPSAAKQPPSARDFQAEAEEALKGPQGKGEGESKLGKVIREWFDYDKNAVVQWIESLDDFVNHNGEIAIEGKPGWHTMNTRNYRSETANHLAKIWAQKDPEAAAGWAMRLPDGGSARQVALSQVAFGWAEKDIDSALKWATQLPDGTGRDGALHSVSIRWARQDPEAVAKWGEQLPEGQLRVSVLLFVTSQLANKDPIATAEWAMRLSEGKEKDGVILPVVARVWAGKDPAAALEWAMQLPEGQVRDKALAEMAPALAGNDGLAAYEVAMKLPEGKAEMKHCPVWLGNGRKKILRQQQN